MFPLPTIQGRGRTALLLLAGLPVLAGKVATFNVNHIASSDALVWQVEFEAPQHGESLRYRTGGETFNLPADRRVKIPFHGSCSFLFDRSRARGSGAIRFKLLDDGNRAHHYRITDGGDLADLDAGQKDLAEAAKGVLSLVPVGQSQTGLATIAILQNALKP